MRNQSTYWLVMIYYGYDKATKRGEIMKAIVIYETKFGSTGKYAHLIGQQLDIPVEEYHHVDPTSLADYDLIILGGCLISGTIHDAELFSQWITMYPDKEWILYTVGLSNPSLTDFNALLLDYFTPEILSKLKTFHFRGTIRYKRLNLMYDLVKQAHLNRMSSIDTVVLDEEAYNLLQTYGTMIDGEDMPSVAPLVNYVQEKI